MRTGKALTLGTQLPCPRAALSLVASSIPGSRSLCFPFSGHARGQLVLDNECSAQTMTQHASDFPFPLPFKVCPSSKRDRLSPSGGRPHHTEGCGRHQRGLGQQLKALAGVAARSLWVEPRLCGAVGGPGLHAQPGQPGVLTRSRPQRASPRMRRDTLQTWVAGTPLRLHVRGRSGFPAAWQGWKLGVPVRPAHMAAVPAPEKVSSLKPHVPARACAVHWVGPGATHGHAELGPVTLQNPDLRELESVVAMGEAMALRSPVGARSWCLPPPSAAAVVSRRRALSTSPERSSRLAARPTGKVSSRDQSAELSLPEGVGTQPDLLYAEGLFQGMYIFLM